MANIFNTAIIFNIQRYSLHDGPGIRTTVFFKGCPLSCLWCHNPESQNFHKEVLFYENKCIACGRCAAVCSNGGVPNKAACVQCGACCVECPTNARVMAGKEMSVEEILDAVEKDHIFYDQSGGGVTLSGGEPLSQYEFLVELAKALKQKRLSVTLDTSGYASWDKLSALMPYVDLFLYDVKCINDNKHIENTGVSNEMILNNLIQLKKAGGNVIIRIPIVPGMNDSNEELEEYIKFFHDNTISYPINLLPYHNISMEKYKRLNRSYALNIKEPDKEQMESIKVFFESNGFQTTIGG